MTRAELRKLCEEATPGPVQQVGDLLCAVDPTTIKGDGPVIKAILFRAECDAIGWDMDFYAASRTAIPQLLDKLDVAEKALEFYAEKGNVFGQADSFLERSPTTPNHFNQAGTEAREALAKIRGEK